MQVQRGLKASAASHTLARFEKLLATASDLVTYGPAEVEHALGGALSFGRDRRTDRRWEHAALKWHYGSRLNVVRGYVGRCETGILGPTCRSWVPIRRGLRRC